MTRYTSPEWDLSLSLYKHRFGMTGESLVLLSDVRRVDGAAVSAEAHERTAQHLHALGLI